jgi:hypothetical protein
MHCDDIKQKDYNKSQSTVNQQICNVNKGETDYKRLHKERKKQYAMWDVIEQLGQNGLTSFMHTPAIDPGAYVSFCRAGIAYSHPWLISRPSL